jgi:predicted ester cyclase
MRRRSPVLLAAVLALATGLVVYQLGALLTEASPTPAHEAADAGPEEHLVGTFYDAVDEAIRSGQSADLDRLLAPDFVDHGGPPDLPPTAAGFRQHLRALAVTFPALRLRQSDAYAHGDLVVAHVAIDDAGQGTFLGLPLAGLPPPWGTVDVFRVAAGAIAEHWGGDATAPVLNPSGQWPLGNLSVAFQTAAMTRTVVAAGTDLELGTILGPEAVYAETGRLAVAIAPAATPAQLWRAGDAGATDAGAALAPGTATVLAPGDLLLLPQVGKATAHPEGGVPATFLTVGSQRLAGRTWPLPATAAPAATPGVVVTDLAGSLPAALSGGPARLGLGRATLAPGAVLPVRADGIAVVAVEAGVLGLAKTAGLVWTRRAEDGAVTTATGGIRTAGDAVVVEAGAGGELRNAGDVRLVLLVATISPGG